MFYAKDRRTLHTGDPDARPDQSAWLNEGLTPGEQQPTECGKPDTHEQQRPKVGDPRSPRRKIEHGVSAMVETRRSEGQDRTL